VGVSVPAFRAPNAAGLFPPDEKMYKVRPNSKQRNTMNHCGAARRGAARCGGRANF